MDLVLLLLAPPPVDDFRLEKKRESRTMNSIAEAATRLRLAPHNCRIVAVRINSRIFMSKDLVGCTKEVTSKVSLLIDFVSIGIIYLCCV